jgi:aminopeptidase-like protein
LHAHSGSTKLRSSALNAEYAKVVSANEAERQGATDITMALDGWSTQRMESVMGWVLRMCDGHVQVLDLTDISDLRHTADKLAGAHLRVAATLTCYY